ncbi:biotin-dependent carboxyltransferase family protein [Szabonella alba]|uniref:Urea amidolyase n=1 Tax=Szabonella alba TaxID=2804194 RepID=A0A8K0V9Q2_9RHOB|nr:biotin-dependent carboxyltransferase family protein [Szabonella alba]MBL4916243.1 urea amidolyase [Szabonella alba]
MTGASGTNAANAAKDAARLTVLSIGPQVTVQDGGRPGHIAQGLSRGGAADPLALLEAAAVLGLAQPGPGLELAGFGGRFRAGADLRLALTGAPMQAEIEGQRLDWNRAHWLRAGQVLSIGGATAGQYGYLTFAAPLRAPLLLGSPSAHLAAGLGSVLRAGDVLEFGPDPDPALPMIALAVADRFSGGSLRIAPGPQTGLFDASCRARLAETDFRRGAQANRQGMRLEHPGAGFSTAAAAGLVSDFVGPGDVQMTGDGLPYILLAECQTIGGYPRIGTVIGADIPRASQSGPGAPLRFHWVTTDEADRLRPDPQAMLAALRRTARPVIRDPATIPDLLAYQLVGGVTAGDDLDRGK